MTPEQYITNKCVEANPSIMELKFGCRVRLRNSAHTTIVLREYPILDNKITDGPYYTLFQYDNPVNSKIIEILGRPITIADVALILPKNTMMRFAKGLDGVYRFFIDILTTCSCEKKHDVCKPIEWNLLTDLNGQSEETKTLLAKILGWKAE